MDCSERVVLVRMAGVWNRYREGVWCCYEVTRYRWKVCKLLCRRKVLGALGTRFMRKDLVHFVLFDFVD